jgi:hypothetical protein
MRLVKRKADVYQRQHDSGERSTTVAPPASVPFAVFEKLLYDYQLQGRLKLLEHFRLVFSEVDSDRVGVLTQQMFRDLVARVAPRKSDAELHKMIDRMDPCGHDSITFSDVRPGNALPILHDTRTDRSLTLPRPCGVYYQIFGKIVSIGGLLRRQQSTNAPRGPETEAGYEL